MGRPKGSPNKSKENEMDETPEVNGNIVETVETASAPTPQAETSNLAKDLAYSIVFDSKTNRWVAVEILFNYAAGTLGGMKAVEVNPNKFIIVERFQSLVGRNLL